MLELVLVAYDKKKMTAIRGNIIRNDDNTTTTTNNNNTQQIKLASKGRATLQFLKAMILTVYSVWIEQEYEERLSRQRRNQIILIANPKRFYVFL